MLKLPCLTYFSNSFLNLFGVCLSVHKPSWLSKHVCVCLFLKLFFFLRIPNMFSEKILIFQLDFVLASPWFFSWLLFSSHPPSQYVSKFLVFSFNNTNDYKITARKALLTSMTICYSVQQEAQTLVSYENLWFVYLSLRALGVPRLELCCWKRSYWAWGSKYTKTMNCGPSYLFFPMLTNLNIYDPHLGTNILSN